MSNVVLPAQNVSIQKPTSEIDPIWYEKLKAIEAFVNLFAIDPKAVTAGQALKWDATKKQFVPV